MRAKEIISSEHGFSLVELLVVITLIVILTTFALLGRSSTRLFAADTQALTILDILQEARQSSLNQGKTFRVELNDTKKLIRLIDEKETVSASDDVILLSKNFDPSTTVGIRPSNVSGAGGVVPPGNSPIPEIQYTQTTYPFSATDKVRTLRFLKTGEVVDAGTDNLGTGAITSGVTIYVYNGASGSQSNVVRAITVNGITAAAQLFKCQTNSQGSCTKWAN